MYEKDAPHVSEELWKFIEEKQVPLLGICYGLQEIAHHYGGVVAPCDHREYGHAMVGIVKGLEGFFLPPSLLTPREGRPDCDASVRGSG